MYDRINDQLESLSLWHHLLETKHNLFPRFKFLIAFSPASTVLPHTCRRTHKHTLDMYTQWHKLQLRIYVCFHQIGAIEQREACDGSCIQTAYILFFFNWYTTLFLNSNVIVVESLIKDLHFGSHKWICLDVYICNQL